MAEQQLPEEVEEDEVIVVDPIAPGQVELDLAAAEPVKDAPAADDDGSPESHEGDPE